MKWLFMYIITEVSISELIHYKNMALKGIPNLFEMEFNILGILPNTKNNELRNVKYDLRRINEKSYQIVIMDDSIKLSQKATQKIYEALLYEYQSYGFYIWTEYSGTSPPSAWKK